MFQSTGNGSQFLTLALGIITMALFGMFNVHRLVSFHLIPFYFILIQLITFFSESLLIKHEIKNI